MYAMTAERIDRLGRYAYGVYSRDRERYYCREGDFQDFRQTVLLYGLQYPEDSPALLIQRIKYARKSPTEEIPYKLENIPPLSAFLDEDGELIEVSFKRESVATETETDESWLSELGKRLFRSEKSNEEFQDYMRGGNEVSPARRRDIRVVLFNHRFEILEFMRERDLIEEREYERLEKIAEEMTKPARVPKVLKDYGEARANREYYQRNKAKFAARAKKNYENRKTRATANGAKEK